MMFATFLKNVCYRYLVPCDSMGARRGNMRVRVLRSVCNWSTGLKCCFFFLFFVRSSFLFFLSCSFNRCFHHGIFDL